MTGKWGVAPREERGGECGPEIVIERAGPGDAGEVLTVQRAAYVAEAQLYGDPFIPSLVESVEQLRKALSGDAVVLKAVLGGRIVGAVRAQFSGSTCLVGRLVVAPDLQRRGIGRRLLAALEDEVAGRADACVLFTGHLSEGNLRLYRRAGYTETHRERVAAHLTLVHMRKPLVPAGTA
ncbi:ribosomal protein S18 acetylase RimI-like enzyme [Actinomadura hallensis]|uniref:Ribosomal protein S18 acetylase RimI-like enzyme n=1 Tax=Actinomadura hallensis TaxID=337895 RepID=A0A543IH85_9ACTN|nr:GNAT family N-acetyltransferase [Actinomadura hallensis]TQM69924.1 ribosomal protein S18 acetylase RimI-like enzyme [Actinomadura hallensis]